MRLFELKFSNSLTVFLNYQVPNCRRVRHVATGNFLHGQIGRNKSEFYQVGRSQNGEQVLVCIHLLVGKLFALEIYFNK